jgi:hypothetical protein
MSVPPTDPDSFEIYDSHIAGNSGERTVVIFERGCVLYARHHGNSESG